eukprot:6586140-Prymnesium_polylepis.2
MNVVARFVADSAKTAARGARRLPSLIAFTPVTNVHAPTRRALPHARATHRYSRRGLRLDRPLEHIINTIDVCVWQNLGPAARTCTQPAKQSANACLAGARPIQRLQGYVSTCETK